MQARAPAKRATFEITTAFSVLGGYILPDSSGAYPESDDIDPVTQAVKAGRSLSRAGLYWNASYLEEIGSPKFWPKEILEPILAQYERDHPAPPQRPTPICNGR